MFIPVLFRPKRRLFYLNAPLLSVDFSAALADPYPCKVGFLHKADASGAMSAGGGVLTVNGTLGAAEGLIGSDNSGTPITYPRVPGRTFSTIFPTQTAVSNAVRCGLDTLGLTGSSIQIGFDFATSASVRVKEFTMPIRTVVLGAGAKQFSSVMRAVGGRLICKVGSATPTTLWIYPSNNAGLFAKLLLAGATSVNFTSDDWLLWDYPPLSTDADASVNVTPTNGTIYTAQADGQVWQFFALGAGSANLVAVELWYRVQDSSNRWTQYIKRNAGNSAWDQLVDSVVAGTPTNRKTTTGVGTPTGQSVFTTGNTHEAYTDTGSATTPRGSNITNSSFNTATGIASAYDASTTIGLLQSWPLTNPVYAGLFS